MRRFALLLLLSAAAGCIDLVGFQPGSQSVGTVCYTGAGIAGSYVASATSRTPTDALVTITSVENAYVHGRVVKAWVGTSGEPGLVDGFPFEGPQYLP